MDGPKPPVPPDGDLVYFAECGLRGSSVLPHSVRRSVWLGCRTRLAFTDDFFRLFLEPDVWVRDATGLFAHSGGKSTLLRLG